MTKTDRQTDKSSRWAFTAYEDQYQLVDDMSKSQTVAEYGWNPEVCPETNRKHRQGFLRTKVQVRFSALRREFPGIHFEVAKNWDALVNYCKKEETREKGKESFSGTGGKEQPLTMAQALMKLASYADPKPILIENHPHPGPDGTTIFIDIWDQSSYDVRAMYVSAVKNWLKINPNIIALVSQPQYKSAFMDFWLDFQALAIQTFEFDGEGIVLRPEPDEGESVEVPEDDWSEYSFLD